MGSIWRVRLFGGLQAQRPGRVVSRFRTQKTASLFSYLACHCGQPQSREQLTELIWPEQDPVSARGSLRTALSSLRQQLEDEAVPPGSVLTTSRQHVLLQEGSLTSDVGDFRRALRAAELSGEGRLSHLAQAAELYRGELLPDLYDDWALDLRATLASQAARALAELATEYERRGELGSALGAAARLVELEPCSEAGHLLLMRLLLRGGDAAGAIRQFGELERCLRRHLDTEPGRDAGTLLRQAREQLGAAAPEVVAANPQAPAPVERTLTCVAAHGLEGSSLPPREELEALGGVLLRRPGAALFLLPGAAQAAALALRLRAANAGARISLHTGDEPSRAGETLAPVAERLLEATRPGQILCSQSTARLLQRSRNAPALHDLGAFRLSGETGPERLFLLAPHEEGPPQRPNATPAAATALPQPLTRFFGRAAELEELVELLTRPAGPGLLTLSGTGGSGKTRLALETAHRLAGGGLSLWWVPLQDCREAQGVLEAILLAAAAPASGADVSRVTEILGPEPVILFLDNFEQLVPAGCDVVGQLLSRLPQLRCVVTSRHRLQLEGEEEFPVRALSLPSPSVTLEELARVPSVELFLDRARRARPDFRLSAANAQAVAELCRRLEGLPLALELVAARAQALSPGQILARLGEHLDWKGSRATVVTRHQSLRAALDWSYALLSEELRQFLEALSVFRGGWSLAAAEAVTGHPDALHCLAQLRACSLIVAEDEGEEVRYRMLDTIRQYAEDRLEAGDRGPELRRRHAEYLVELAEQAAPHLSGASQSRWMDRLVAEHENIRAALAWLAGQPEHATLALRLTSALRLYWVARSFWEEGERELLRALENAPDAPESFRAPALVSMGLLASCRHHFSLAFRCLEEARALNQEVDNTAGLGDTYLILGGAHLRKGQIPEAEAAWLRAEALLRECGNLRGMITTRRNLGLLSDYRHDYEASLEHYSECLRLAERIQAPDRLADALRCRGYALQQLGRLEDARAAWVRSRRVYRELHDRSGAAFAAHYLALLEWETGNAAGALSGLLETLAEFQAIREHWMVAQLHRDLAEVLAEEGRRSEATEHLEAALSLARDELHDARMAANVLTLRASLARKAGEPLAAELDLREALRHLRDADLQDAQVELLPHFAALLQHRTPERALRAAAAAAALSAASLPLSPQAAQLLDRTIAGLREPIASERWQELWEEGQADTLEQAVERLTAERDGRCQIG